MKGSNIAVDVYSRLAIFHGQCATALFNTHLPFTLGFLFNSGTFIFSEQHTTKREPCPRRCAAARCLSREAACHRKARCLQLPCPARLCEGQLAGRDAARAPLPCRERGAQAQALPAARCEHRAPAPPLISSSNMQTVPSQGSSFACKLRLCTSPLSLVIA